MRAAVDGVSDADVKAKLTSAIAPFAVPPLLARYVEGTFDFAFVNHAPMEVGSAVADVRSNSAEVLAGHQVADRRPVRGGRRGRPADRAK